MTFVPVRTTDIDVCLHLVFLYSVLSKPFKLLDVGILVFLF